MKIAMIFPYAPSYREGIYRLMDKELKIDWFFCGNAKRNLKLLDNSLLKNCDLTMQEKSIGAITYYKGIKKIKLHQYDAIICAGVIRSLSEWWLLQKWGRKINDVKIYVWTHGWYGKESLLQKIIKKLFFRKVDGFLLYGDYARNKMIQEGFDEKKLYVIKNSLDYDKQILLRKKMMASDLYHRHFNNDRPTIVFIGRLTPVKKLDVLIKAVNLLKHQGEQYNLVFIGDGEMRNTLELEVEKYELKDHVWFYGSCYDEKVNAELIYNADLCVAPGNIGLTAIHSLMFGCPAVSHNDYKWQMPEFESIIEGKTGTFFKRDDESHLAISISQWFRLHKNSRDEVRQLCYTEIDEHWNPYYQINLIKRVLGLL